MPTLSTLLVCVAMLKRLLAPTPELVVTRMASRARSAEDACSDDVIWTKKDAQIHKLTKSVRAMLLKDMSAQYDSEDESQLPAASRQLMICAVAMDPRFKSFALKLCTGVGGESARQDTVWANVRQGHTALEV
jgi:hypothetical protein